MKKILEIGITILAIATIMTLVVMGVAIGIFSWGVIYITIMSKINIADKAILILYMAGLWFVWWILWEMRPRP